MLPPRLPGYSGERGRKTGGAGKTAGVECAQAPAAKVDAWKAAGFCATATDLSSYEKLAQPGVEYRPDVASATRAPWVISNAWRLLRAGAKPVYYDACKARAAFGAAAASAYC